LAGGEAFVSSGLLVWVGVGGWDDFGVAVGGHAHGPVLVCLHAPFVLGFDLLVVVSAEQRAVVEAGVAAVPPGGEVVGVAVAWWTVAARKGAALVPDGEGLAEGAAEQALLAAEVEGLAGAVADDGEDVGVTREQPCLRRGDLFAGVEQRRGGESVDQRGVVEEQVDAGSVATVGGSVTAALIGAGEFDQSLSRFLCKESVCCG